MTSFETDGAARKASTEATPGCVNRCGHPENHVTMHRSWLSLWPWLLCFFVVSLISIHFSRNVPLSILVVPFEIFGTTYEAHMPLMGLILAFILARPMFLMYDTNHELRCHHLRTLQGRCSLNRQVVEISYEDMRGVRVEQPLLQRIVDVGTIVVGTAMTDEPKVHLKGIRHPEQFAHMITERIDTAHLHYQTMPSS